MWPFKKKGTKKVVDRPLRVVEYRKEKHDIGRTLIKYTLLDGRKINSWYYGSYSQYVNNSWSLDKPEHTVGELYINKSLLNAQNILASYTSQYVMNLIDDEKNPTKSVSGQPIAAEIVKTESYEEECNVAYLVDNKDGK